MRAAVIPEQGRCEVAVQHRVVGVYRHTRCILVLAGQAAPWAQFVALHPGVNPIKADSEAVATIAAVPEAVSREIDGSVHGTILFFTT